MSGDKKIEAIDFFCGAGGLTQGLKDAGIMVRAGIDNNDDYKETYKKNNKGVEFIPKDIRDLKEEEIRGHLSGQDNYTLFCGCAPCQPFSQHFKKDGSEDDERKFALHVFADIVDVIEPDFVFSENVPGIEDKYSGEVWNYFIQTLEDNDYYHSFNPVDAKDYGVPQRRKRMILLASKHDKTALPGKTHSNDSYKTVRDAISDYPSIKAGEEDESYPNHKSAGLSELNKKRMRNTPKDGGSRKDWPKDLWLDCHKKDGVGYADVYGRMKWDEPSPTLTCKCYSISNGRFGHPEQNRAISLREAAKLQTFPDDYEFYGGSNYSIGSQIGNAVPPKLAEKIGLKFKKHKNELIEGTPK